MQFFENPLCDFNKSVGSVNTQHFSFLPIKVRFGQLGNGIFNMENPYVYSKLGCHPVYEKAIAS